MNQGLEIEGFLHPLREQACRDRLWRPVAQPRGTALMTQGGTTPALYVLCAGLVKLAYLTPEGGERIKSFIVDLGVFGAGTSDADARFSAITLEPSTIVALPSSWFTARLNDNPAIRAAYAGFEAWLRARKEAREEALLCQSAEARYLDLLRHEPGLVRRLQQADIARYIGVTPIAFSRIKRRIARQAR